MSNNSNVRTIYSKTNNMRREDILITPEMAQSLLEENKDNRELDQEMVNEIALDMMNAEFDYENTHVVLDTKGNFYYGQHILNAIIKNDKASTVDVITVELGDKFTTMRRGYYNKWSKYHYTPKKKHEEENEDDIILEH